MSLRGVKRRGNLLSFWSKRDCFTSFAMTAIKWDFNGRAAFTITRPLENGKMNGYRIKSGMTKGEIKKGSGEPLWKQFNLLWLGG